MWDGQSSVHRSFQRSEHFVPGGGSGEAGVQVAGERPRLAVDTLHVELLTRHLHLALVHLIQTELIQQLQRDSKDRSRVQTPRRDRKEKRRYGLKPRAGSTLTRRASSSPVQ